ncbi:Stemmadenine O-acetyltransferase [Linum grandiflorum]
MLHRFPIVVTAESPARSTSDNNLFIHSFNEGVPFIHVQANCSLSDFLKHHHPDSLNLLLPHQPFHKQPPPAGNRVISYPVLELQISFFSCGGFSLGFSCSHKLIDAFTLKSFLALFSAVPQRQRRRRERNCGFKSRSGGGVVPAQGKNP